MDQIIQEQSSFNETNVLLDQMLIETKEAIHKILQQEILKDLPKDVTREEIKSELQLIHGHSIKLYLLRADGVESTILVPSKDTTVIELKKIIERQTNLNLKRNGETRKISWKYIWKTYWLSFDNMKLKNDNELLTDLGIENNSIITFAKRLKDKTRIR